MSDASIFSLRAILVMLFSVGYVIVGVGLCGEMWLVHGIPVGVS